MTIIDICFIKFLGRTPNTLKLIYLGISPENPSISFLEVLNALYAELHSGTETNPEVGQDVSCVWAMPSCPAVPVLTVWVKMHYGYILLRTALVHRWPEYWRLPSDLNGRRQRYCVSASVSASQQDGRQTSQFTDYWGARSLL